MKHLPIITIDAISANLMRYPGGGDYDQHEDGDWWIRVAEHKKWQYEALCVVHEMIEMILTKHRKISWNKITKFDMDNPDLNDPGRDKRAPYRKEHLFAGKIERMVCKELGLDFKEYDKSFDNLKY